MGLLQDSVVKSGEAQVEETLLEGHLGITKELLSLQTPEKKYHIGAEKGGPNLIKVRLQLCGIVWELITCLMPQSCPVTGTVVYGQMTCFKAFWSQLV